MYEERSRPSASQRSPYKSGTNSSVSSGACHVGAEADGELGEPV
jgi:hypothetical protein